MGRRVVVVGGGYGGSLVAKALDTEADVVLVDTRDSFVNAAGMLRAVTRPDWAPNVFFPYSTLLEHGRFIQSSAVSVDPKGVTLTSGDRINADYLVLATGSTYSYPGKPTSQTTTDALRELRATNNQLAGAERVLILGAGPVGLELCGEIKEVWPDKHVIIVAPGDILLPGYLPSVRDNLHKQLEALGVELRLSTELVSMPETNPGCVGRFSVKTDAGHEIIADIWFRAFGLRINSDYLSDGKLVRLTEDATVPVSEKLNVSGHGHVYALGDIVDLAEPKMATYAQTHAEIVVANIRAQLAGDEPVARYVPTADRRILVPLGSRGGVGQLPAVNGVVEVSIEMVAQRKGSDLFTTRFAQRFNVRDRASALN